MLKDQIHSAISNNIDEFIILFGQKHTYKIDVNDSTLAQIKNTRLMSVQMIDDNYCYAVFSKNTRC
jgi:hypothetical protein